MLLANVLYFVWSRGTESLETPKKLENLSLNIYFQKFLLFYRLHLCIRGNLKLCRLEIS